MSQLFSKPVQRLAVSGRSATYSLHQSATTSLTAVSFSTSTRAGTGTASSSRPSQGGHQRRPSSSKASCPPGGSQGRSESAADGQPAKPSTTVEEKQNAATPEDQSNGPGKSFRRKAKDTSNAQPNDRALKTKFEQPYMNLPHVPSTTYLHPNDVHLSSFFSLHRPISVTTPIPPSNSSDAFQLIFEPAAPDSETKTQDVIYAFANMTVENLQHVLNGKSQQEKDHRREILAPSTPHTDSGESIQLDAVPASAFDDMIKHYRPFHVPSVPVPFDDIVSQQQTMPDSERAVSTPRRTDNRTFTASLTIRESTSSSGEETYTVLASPFVEQRKRRASESSGLRKPQQPFLARMRQRQIRTAGYIEAKLNAAALAREEQQHIRAASGNAEAIDVGDRAQGESDENPMLLISVKRQRKLKMKKHKYKKLMKRTRVLRRKEGRV